MTVKLTIILRTEILARYLPADAISPPKRLPVPIFDGACALIETGGRVEVAPS